MDYQPHASVAAGPRLTHELGFAESATIPDDSRFTVIQAGGVAAIVALCAVMASSLMGGGSANALRPAS